jgi:hypothetical protein
MADHIPFITGQDACKLVAKHYSDSEHARVQLDRAGALLSHIPKQIKIWLDPGVDGLDDLESRRSSGARTNNWFEFMKKVPGFEEVGKPEFHAKPDPKIVREFVVAVLDLCFKHKPAWITVPQLPRASDSSRNGINRLLAKATGEWKSSHEFTGRLILPIIFMHQDQVNGKTQRNPQVKLAGRCYHESQADGFWVVDKSLDDESGSKTLRNTRVPAIVMLHEELNEEISSKIRIAGPYWGVNLLLWARGLVDFPAIGVGNAYQYFLAGGHAKTPATCLAISVLRRRVGVARLEKWLQSAANALGLAHPATAGLEQMRKQINLLSLQEPAREQVAKFYKTWFDLLAGTPRAGRPMALFQDLSAAFAVGKSLPDFEDEGTARRPESVVEPLMLNCL